MDRYGPEGNRRDLNGDSSYHRRGLELTEMDRNGPESIEIDRKESEFTRMDLNAPEWTED